MINHYKPYQHGAIYRGAPHTEQELTDKERHDIMQCYHAWFVRNVYDFDCKEETSFWFIIQDKALTIEELPTKCRNQVRRSLKTLNFGPLTREEFLEEGYNVYKSAFDRYKIKTSVPMSEARFKEKNRKADESIEFWGARERDTGKLVAYAKNLIQSGAVKYTALKGIPEYLNKYYPFYGLLFEMNRHYIEERKMLYVTDGARSISEHSNIQTFLEKFRFRKAYCRLNVTYVGWLKIIINILYPFRNLFRDGKIGYLLRFEAINRNEY